MGTLTVFKKVLLIGMVPVVAFVALFFAIVLPQFERHYLQSKQDGARDVVEMALTYAQAQVEQARKGAVTQAEAQRATLRAVDAMRYQQGTNYVFILDGANLTMLVNATRPGLVGHDVTEETDGKGFHHYQALRAVALRPDGGFVRYFQIMGDGSIRPKLAYARNLESWNWIFVSGVYVDTIRPQLAGMARRTAIPLLVLACLMEVTAALVAKIIVRPFRFLVADLEASGPTTRLPVRSQDEFGNVAKAINAYNAMTKLNADFAHELRTPLQALRLEVEALAQDPHVADLEGRLGVVAASLDQVLALSEQMLFLARAEDPATRIQKVTLDAAAFLTEAMAPFDALAEEKDVRLERHGEPGMTIWADPLLATRAVRNLVSNALRHAPAHSRITVGAQREGREDVVCVADAGPGMEPGLLLRVGQRFLRSDAARSKETGGTGLGLAIVNGIMTLHGGKLELQSTWGAGTQARLRFPST
jgi:signal transduction histidine kinase